MKTFKNNDLKTFEQLASLNQASLWKVMIGFLKKNYRKTFHTADYVIAEGDIPVALVAHLDTVFSAPPEEIFFDREKNVLWSPDGLGADDRAGVFAIVQIIRAGFRPHIIFTTDEEIGGVGAAKVSLLDMPFKDLKYVIELDRRGSNDCVFYDCENRDFEDYVESFGFEYNFGSYSDISDICPAWGIAGVNLSIGYRDEHSVAEVLFVGQMLSTIEKVKKMLQDVETLEKPFKYIPSKTKYHYWGYGSDWYHGGYSAYSSDYGYSGVRKCSHCHKYYMEEELYPVKLLDNTTGFYCGECLAEVAWCPVCSSAHQKICPEMSDDALCQDCVKAKENKDASVDTTNKH